MITIAKKGNQTESININLSDSFKELGFTVLNIETEYNSKKDKENSWMNKFGN